MSTRYLRTVISETAKGVKAVCEIVDPDLKNLNALVEDFLYLSTFDSSWSDIVVEPIKDGIFLSGISSKTYQLYKQQMLEIRQDAQQNKAELFIKELSVNETIPNERIELKV